MIYLLLLLPSTLISAWFLFLAYIAFTTPTEELLRWYKDE